jgi:hypothetical protein
MHSFCNEIYISIKIATLLVRSVEHLIPLILEYKNLTAANSHLLNEIIRPHFWLVQLCLLVFFFMYNTLREAGRILGREQVRSMFLARVV